MSQGLWRVTRHTAVDAGAWLLRKPGCGSRAVIIEDDKERSDRRGSPAGPRCRISEVNLGLSDRTPGKAQPPTTHAYRLAPAIFRLDQPAHPRRDVPGLWPGSDGGRLGRTS